MPVYLGSGHELLLGTTGQTNFLTSLGSTFRCRFGGVQLMPLRRRRWRRRGQLECDALPAEAAHAQQDGAQHGEQEEGGGLIGWRSFSTAVLPLPSFL